MLLKTLAVTAVLSVVFAVSIDRRAAITDFTEHPVGFAWPPPRGFNAGTANKAPCGGFVAGTRVNYPVTGGEIALTGRTQVDNVNILWTKEANPTRFHSFSTYTNSLLDFGSGHYCQSAPDFTSLGLSAGDEATIMIMYQLENSTQYYYECADLSLVTTDGFMASVQYVCGNYTNTLQEATEDESLHVGSTSQSSGTTSVAAEATSDSLPSSEQGTPSTSSISAAAGGGIGAAVAIVAVALLVSGAYVAGYVRFGRKTSAVLADHASDSSGVPIKSAHA